MLRQMHCHSAQAHGHDLISGQAYNQWLRQILFIDLSNQISAPNCAMYAVIVSLEKPIILYGTSIAQGACASRPAMAWGTILQRSLDYPLINLGFSGNGKLAKEVLQFIGETDARLYILDCMPNLPNQKEEDITALAIAAVKQLREKHSAPILLIEHGGYSNIAVTCARRTVSMTWATEISIFFLRKREAA